MLINNDIDDKGRNVKFVSYTGKYPNLCSGILTLEIDGKEYKFGHDYNNYDWKNNRYKDNNFPSFWSSGGGITNDYTSTYQNQWEIDVSELPEQLRKYAVEIDYVFNTNVEYGCCGGCI